MKEIMHTVAAVILLLFFIEACSAIHPLSILARDLGRAISGIIDSIGESHE